MTGQQSSAERMPQALEVADGYLDEAQDVLWKTASMLTDNTERQRIEELTEDIWDIQNQINDFQREIQE